MIGIAFVLILLQNGTLELICFFLGHGRLAFAGELVLFDGEQHIRGLFPAHDGDAGVGPHPQEARAVGASAHGVVARAERAADDHGQLGDAGGRHRMDHLGAVLGDAADFGFTSHHEAGDVLQEHQRDAALVAQLDEVRRFERGLAEQHAVVGDDARQGIRECARTRRRASCRSAL